MTWQADAETLGGGRGRTPDGHCECGHRFAPGETVWTETADSWCNAENARKIVCEACASTYGGLPVLDSHPCGGCGRTIATRYPALLTYCSERCEMDAKNQRARDKRADEREKVAQCERCGSSFTTTRTDARFCSNAHRQAAYRARKAVTAT